MNAIGSWAPTASFIRWPWARIWARAAGEACQSASSIMSGSRASRIRTASATEGRRLRRDTPAAAAGPDGDELARLEQPDRLVEGADRDAALDAELLLGAE